MELENGRKNLDKILSSGSFSDGDIVYLLSLREEKEVRALAKRAFDETTRQVGENVYFRGLIEVSNICTLNCRYCGIRRANHALNRYEMKKEEIVELALWAANHGLGNICLQSGERQDEKFVDFISECLKEIHRKTVSERLPNGLGITLSLGDQEKNVYERWAEASGNQQQLRYLARFETSNERLFDFLHSAKGKSKTLDRRLRALKDLRKCGYQVGTGVMIGIPGQTLEDLCADIRLFEELGIDMLGMGPYLRSDGGELLKYGQMEPRELLQLSLNMIAVARLVLKDVNIAAATALDVLDSNGRAKAINFGANVLMPNLTQAKYKSGYQLYDHKPSVEKEASSVLEKVVQDVLGSHRKIAWNLSGSSPHWRKRQISNSGR